MSGCFTTEVNVEFWKKIWQIAKEFKVMLAGALLLAMTAQVVGFLPMLAQKSFFDAIESWLRGDGMSLASVALTVGSLVGAGVMADLMAQLSHYLSDRLQTRMAYRLAGSTADHLLRLSLGFHTRHDTAEKLDVVGQGLSSAHQIVWIALTQSLPALCQMAVFAVWTCAIAPLPGAVMVLGASVTVAYGVIAQRQLRPVRREYRDTDRAAGVYKNDALRNIRSVKAVAAEGVVLGEIVRRNELLLALSETLSLRFFGIGSRQTMLRHAVSGMVLVIAVWQMFGGNATLGMVTLLFGVTNRLIGAMQNTLQGYNAVEHMRPDAEKLFELLDVKPDVVAPAHPVPLGSMIGSVAFENVSFAYPDTAGTIEGVSFYVPAGKTVAIVGPSGAGKTTLMTLLLRGFDPHGGRILVDGKDLRELDPVEYLRQVGTVAQGLGIFSASVRDNIAFGVEGATQEQIEEAARMAGAHEFIVELKDRYDTQVGEGGVKLSGGQAQRLCIARALLRDPRLLILDEATSHLDVETESRIMEEIITRIKGTRTVVIIAHRLSTIRAADQVVVLDHGRLVQYGSYDDLRSAPGPFRRMVELQADQAIL
jgi:ATP-binding cassette subfamily B protein